MIFAEDLVEGTYVAGRFLLHDPPPRMGTPTCSDRSPDQCFLPVSEGEFSIPDYQAPIWAVPDCLKKATDKNAYKVICPEYLRPVTWLSVMGRDDFYPVAALGQALDPDGSHQHHHLGIRPLGTPISMKLCLSFIVALAFFHLACCWKASFTAKPAFRAHFAEATPAPFGAWRHRVLILTASVVIGFMAIVSLWGAGLFTPDGSPVDSFSWGCRVMALVVLLSLDPSS